MESYTLKLYHGTLETYAIEILSNQKFNHSIGVKHYLGDGIYFYDDPHHASVWGNMKSNDEKFVVLEVIIEVNDIEFMDLDLRLAQDRFYDDRRFYFNSITKRKRESNRGYSDSSFCNLISDIYGVKMLAKTFVYIHKKDKQIPIRFSNERDTHIDITRHLRTEKQYCLRDASLIQKISLWEGDKNDKV